MSPWKSIAAGAAAGMVGSWLMTQLTSLATGSNAQTPQEGKQSPRQARQFQSRRKDPTVAVANTVSKALRGKPLAPPQKSLGGAAVHYGFGASMGALYGALAYLYPSVRVGRGTLYGTAVWLIADETMLPALSVSLPPWRLSAATQARMELLHLVFGLTLEQGLRIAEGKPLAGARVPEGTRDRSRDRGHGQVAPEAVPNGGGIAFG